MAREANRPADGICRLAELVLRRDWEGGWRAEVRLGG